MHPLAQRLLEKINNHIDIINPRLQDCTTEYGASDLSNWDKILTIYDMLNDDESKKIFADVIILHVSMMLFPLTTVKKHFSIFSPSEWDKLISEAEKMKGLPVDYILDRVETWLLKCYEYKEYKAEPGDIVIEGGCFTGNTTCYFANLIQQQGKIYSFEPNPQIFSQLCENTKNYPQVIPVNSGISSHDYTAKITNSGTASTVVEKGEISITLRSIIISSIPYTVLPKKLSEAFISNYPDFTLINFSFITDSGEFIESAIPQSMYKQSYGCGCFTLQKNNFCEI